MSRKGATVVSVSFDEARFTLGYSMEEDGTVSQVVMTEPASVLVEEDGQIYVGQQAETRSVSQSLKSPGQKRLHLYRSCGKLLYLQDLDESTQLDARDGHVRKSHEIFSDIFKFCTNLVKTSESLIPAMTSSPNEKKVMSVVQNGQETVDEVEGQVKAALDSANIQSPAGIDELYAKPTKRRNRKSRGSVDKQKPTEEDDALKKTTEAIQSFMFPPPPPATDETDLNVPIPLQDMESDWNWVVVVPDIYEKRERIVKMRKMFDRSLKSVQSQGSKSLNRKFLADLEAAAYFCICSSVVKFHAIPATLPDITITKERGIMVVSFKEYGAKFGAYSKSNKPTKNSLTELYAEWHPAPEEILPKEGSDKHQLGIAFFDWLRKEIDKEEKVVVVDKARKENTESPQADRKVTCRYVLVLGSCYERPESFTNWARAYNFAEKSVLTILLPTDIPHDVVCRGGLYYGQKRHEAILAEKEQAVV